MLRCPHCGGRECETDLRRRARVRLTGCDDGDYQEVIIEDVYTEWDTLECLDCGQGCPEEEARHACEAGACTEMLTAALYDWYEAHLVQWQRGTVSPAEHESITSIAGAEHFWLWQQERG